MKPQADSSHTQIERARKAFESGRLVAIPTETVYGLAAPIDRPALIERIFTVKERPFFDPLIIHVDGINMAKKWVVNWPPAAQLLAEKFWPGPLSLVLPKTNDVDDRISSGLSTVAVRCPDHPLSLQLISAMGVPLAAPSANKFGKTSPTSAAHVAAEFSAEDVEILNGGDCHIGIESTIVKLEQGRAYVLRQGMITLSQLSAVLAPMGIEIELYREQKIEAPGQVKHHYMPAIPVVRLPDEQLAHWHQTITRQLKLKPDAAPGTMLRFDPSPAVSARQLYRDLRCLAESGASYIAWTAPAMAQAQDADAWSSILDRLNRATTLVL